MIDDVIFLLSKKEYLKYKKFIPKLNLRWWLRSPGLYQVDAAYINEYGHIDRYNVGSTNICVRPALRLDKLKINECESKFVYCGVTWLKIGKNIAIAELPISMQKFNKNAGNDYENSYVRKWLLDWYEKRKNY